MCWNKGQQKVEQAKLTNNLRELYLAARKSLLGQPSLHLNFATTISLYNVAINLLLAHLMRRKQTG